MLDHTKFGVKCSFLIPRSMGVPPMFLVLIWQRHGRDAHATGTTATRAGPGSRGTGRSRARPQHVGELAVAVPSAARRCRARARPGSSRATPQSLASVKSIRQRAQGCRLSRYSSVPTIRKSSAHSNIRGNCTYIRGGPFWDDLYVEFAILPARFPQRVSREVTNESVRVCNPTRRLIRSADRPPMTAR